MFLSTPSGPPAKRDILPVLGGGGGGRGVYPSYRLFLRKAFINLSAREVDVPPARVAYGIWKWIRLIH